MKQLRIKQIKDNIYRDCVIIGPVKEQVRITITYFTNINAYGVELKINGGKTNVFYKNMNEAISRMEYIINRTIENFKNKGFIVPSKFYGEIKVWDNE